MKQVIFLTMISINMMLGALMIAYKSVHIEKVVPSLAHDEGSPSRIEYYMELINLKQIKQKQSTTNRKGLWVIEHYREMEYLYNRNGSFIEKRPTSKEEYIRYWKEKK